MSEPRVDAVALRLNRLERENRRLKRVGAAVLAMIATVVLTGQTIAGDTPARPESLPRPPTPASPHWSHINILNFGRSIKYMPNPRLRAAVYDWFASHIDVAEAQLVEFKSRNSGMKVFNYQLDISTCQHMSCKWDRPENIWTANVPEEYFLHFAENTKLKFLARNSQEVATVEIPGCPASLRPNRKCRVQVFIWNDSRWVFNPRQQEFRDWMASRLLRKAGDADGIFLDEHGPGFKIPLKWGSQTQLLAGGGIREYGGRGPLDDRLNREYNTDLEAALERYWTEFRRAGKFLFINTAGYSLHPLSVDQIMAARGVDVEGMHRPDRLDREQYGRLVTMIKKLTEIGGMADLYGRKCYWGPPNYTKGHFSTPQARYHMWKLASYYILKEAVESSGTVYFNPNLCIRSRDSNRALDFVNEWLPAYQVDVGHPKGRSVKYQSGTAPNGCPYTIFARDYTRSLVLLRPRDKWACDDYGENTAVTVRLPSSMSVLKDDGSLSPAEHSIQLRTAEGVILFK